MGDGEGRTRVLLAASMLGRCTPVRAAITTGKGEGKKKRGGSRHALSERVHHSSPAMEKKGGNKNLRTARPSALEGRKKREKRGEERKDWVDLTVLESFLRRRGRREDESKKAPRSARAVAPERGKGGGKKKRKGVCVRSCLITGTEKKKQSLALSCRAPREEKGKKKEASVHRGELPAELQIGSRGQRRSAEYREVPKGGKKRGRGGEGPAGPSSFQPRRPERGKKDPQPDCRPR